LEEKLNIDDRIIAEKTVCILLVKGESPEEIAIYAYVAVRADRLQEFMAAQGTETFYPEDFGVIIEAGEGEPAEDVRRKMETEYGFNEEAMIGIPDARKALELMKSLPDGLWPGREDK
jgi:NADPH-dependent ferric siderophore reductase